MQHQLTGDVPAPTIRNGPVGSGGARHPPNLGSRIREHHALGPHLNGKPMVGDRSRGSNLATGSRS